MLKSYLIFSLFGCFYCIRSKSFFTYSFYNSKGKLVTHHLRDIKPVAQHSKVLKDVLFTRKLFKTNIVVPTYSNHPDDIWYLVTNDDTRYATKNYSYRFGSIECIFKSQKSNGFRLESTNTQKIEHFISLFTVMCITLTWLTIFNLCYYNYVDFKLKFNFVLYDV